MASISAPSFPSPSAYSDPNPQKLCFSRNPKSLPASFSRYSPPLKKSSAQYLNSPSYAHRMYESLICRCQSQPDSPSSPEGFTNGRWDTVLHGVMKNAFEKIEEYLNSYWNRSRNSSSIDVAEKEREKEVEDWDWNRWRKHFKEVEEQELIVSILKSQLGYAVSREEYEDAARLKVAIAAASSKDTVGRVISILNKAIEEERYMDAAFIRDHAGAGLVGWWAGISEDSNDPYGLIIRISAEHGRYVARSYSPRQLATSTATAGVPLFEIFLTMNGKGEYKQQAVYLKRDGGILGDKSTKISKSSSATTNLIDGNNDLSTTSMGETEDSEDNDEDNDEAEGLSGFQNVLQDMIPGVKVKVLKVTIPGKVDRDLISKVIEQIMDEEDEEKEAESSETEDEVKAVSDQEQDEIEMDADDGVPDDDERKEIAVKVVVGGLVHKLSRNMPPKDLLRMPARVEKKSRFSFSFSLEENERKQDAGGKGNALQDGKPNLQGQRSLEHVMSDLAKSIISKEKIPMKVLKDVGELINLTLNQAQNRYPLSGSTVFNRIEIPTSADPLNGLYIGAHGLYTSEVIHLRHKFGQWQDNGVMQEKADLEFYEYVEALKLTGDPYIPAGQVAFRAKVGKRNQLPHKGIIPEEFGVVARYRGQGRLAEPGFRNPRWVDGELVILDGKHIRGGPVVGFVYWAPEYHFLVFFSRLRLQQ